MVLYRVRVSVFQQHTPPPQKIWRVSPTSPPGGSKFTAAIFSFTVRACTKFYINSKRKRFVASKQLDTNNSRNIRLHFRSSMKKEPCYKKRFVWHQTLAFLMVWRPFFIWTTYLELPSYKQHFPDKLKSTSWSSVPSEFLKLCNCSSNTKSLSFAINTATLLQTSRAIWLSGLLLQFCINYSCL